MHRQYDAKLGRFLQRDPLGEASDPNLYRYVYNSPGNATDPMGLVPIWDVIDVAFFAESLSEFKKCRSWGNGLNLALDGLGLLPVLPSLGWLRRADDAYDGWKAAKRSNKRPIVIGENMKDRVIPAAKNAEADYYKPRNTSGNPLDKNVRWIDKKIKEGREIIDIGPDPRRSQRSEFYRAEKERIEKRNYPVTKAEFNVE